ncbi:SPOR domain-containing protein [Novosphingobium sp. PC22D]|uniref:SPOR domain-containing protein n=1 Tax=Novosphingobium sp. PC22D TaxID=1962403 RepID=UPI000BF23751|nr:SPOR domain-containing protein [Novosphingobium sp. PC22D]
MQDRTSTMPLRFALCTALAAALVSGCAGTGHVASAGRGAASPRADLVTEKQVAQAEKQVLKAPNDAAARVTLAQTYLSVGRFASAATTFEDAIALGEVSGRAALGMSLAYIGSGRQSEAVALLTQWRDTIPAGDLGLALALAGSTGEGVSILSDALRGGQDTPKLRQNLAYAYALDGRWREARIMAAQDVPADQLDARISEWARQGRPEDYSRRVASLLGAPVRSDPGQPAMLALGDSAVPASEAAPQFAAADAVPVDETLPQPGRAPQDELPPVRTGESFWGADAGPATDRKPVAAMRPAESEPVVAHDDDFRPTTQPREIAGAVSYVSEPLVQATPRYEGPLARAVSEPAAAPRAVAEPSPGEATHLVQLGSFSSPERARQAWNIYLERNPALRDHKLVLTEAVVRGKHYWRVSAAGFDLGSARALCSGVGGGSHGCIAYAASRPLPGALPARKGSSAMLARN